MKKRLFQYDLDCYYLVEEEDVLIFQCYIRPIVLPK